MRVSIWQQLLVAEIWLHAKQRTCGARTVTVPHAVVGVGAVVSGEEDAIRCELVAGGQLHPRARPNGEVRGAVVARRPQRPKHARDVDGLAPGLCGHKERVSCGTVGVWKGQQLQEAEYALERTTAIGRSQLHDGARVLRVAVSQALARSGRHQGQGRPWRRGGAGAGPGRTGRPKGTGGARRQRRGRS